jgi:hypothetical protein
MPLEDQAAELELLLLEAVDRPAQVSLVEFEGPGPGHRLDLSPPGAQSLQPDRDHTMKRVNSGVMAAKISATSSGVKGRSSSRCVEMTVSVIFASCMPNYSPAKAIWYANPKQTATREFRTRTMSN